MKDVTPAVERSARTQSFSDTDKKAQGDEDEEAPGDICGRALSSYEQMFADQIKKDQETATMKAKAAKTAAAKSAGAGAGALSGMSRSQKRQANLARFNQTNPMRGKAGRRSIAVMDDAANSHANSMFIQQIPAFRGAQQSVHFSYSQPKPKTAEEIAKESMIVQGWLYKRSKLVWKKRFCKLEPKSSMLHYYVGYEQSKKGYIDLKQIASVALCPGEVFVPPRTVCFKLTTIEPPRTWVLAAPRGDKDAAWWLQQLRPDLFRNRTSKS